MNGCAHLKMEIPFRNSGVKEFNKRTKPRCVKTSFQVYVDLSCLGIHCKIVPRFYGKVTGNLLQVHLPLVCTDTCITFAGIIS